MKQKCSIVIPTKDKLSRLYLTLKSIENQVNEDVEVIIVFDGCKEETLEGFKKFCFKFEPIQVILPENMGRAAARNRGIERATGDVLIFLDDDRLAEPDFIQKHMSYHEKRPSVVLGERLDINYTEEQVEELMNRYTIEEVIEKLRKDAYVEVYYRIKKIFLTKICTPIRYLGLMTGNVSIHKSFIDSIGGFDENYKGWGYEDTDLAYRLKQQKIKYITDYSIRCYHLLHERNLKTQRIEELRNRDYFENKYKDDKLLRFILFLYKIKAKLNF